MRGTTLMLVLATGLAAGSSIAYATTSADAPGTPQVHACYRKPGGALRLGLVCGPKERPVAWAVVGPQGPAGPAGPTGPKGDTGPAGVTGYEVVSSGSGSVPNNGSATTTATCPSGKRPTGGGAKSGGSFTMLDSYPSGTTTWTVRLKNTSGGAASYTAYAVCVTSA